MTLSAALPSLADPSIIAFGAALGAFVNSMAARRRSRSRDQWTHATIDGSYYGTAIGILLYAGANLAAILSS